MESLDELYHEVILDHFSNPRCKGEMRNPDASVEVYNPLCGDRVEVMVQVGDDGTIKDISFEGSGCSISQASASMMAEICEGLALDDVVKLYDMFDHLVKKGREGYSEEELEELGDALALEGVRKFPARIRCAVLAWEALREALSKARGGAS
ncbi:MAG: SUF system NifU family Fe-S cluster assembly protein [Candidatus Dadabacteria bacterium]|nr:MAG: SUF system NifU family Fe-S cluster assembly protein [Candidatus Dadabacteria bacterium]